MEDSLKNISTKISEWKKSWDSLSGKNTLHEYINLISGVTGALSGVWGNFQNSKANKLAAEANVKVNFDENPLKESLESIKRSVKNLEEGFMASFGSIGGETKKIMLNATESIDVFVKSADKSSDSLKKIGEALGEGLIDGIKGKKVKISETMQDIATGTEKTVTKTLEINSPSKVFKRIGEYVSEGLGDGIKDGAKFATKAMDSLSDNVVDASKSLSKVEKGADDYKDAMKDVEKATDKVNDKKLSFGGGFMAVVSTVATLGMALYELMSSNEEFSAKMGTYPLFFYLKRKVAKESRLLQSA